MNLRFAQEKLIFIELAT